jgi:predicted 3-demethylubiquinone-9 3-methyltransferase (glyoxalase superfamily)
MNKVTPCLWCDNNVEEMAEFYRSVFKDAFALLESRRHAGGGPVPAGAILSATFRIHDQQFMALNGGPHFKFSPAISFFVLCDTQEEVDHYWESLTAGGGEPNRCGWLTDKFGISWQIVPRILGELTQDPDREKATRTTAAMLKMTKLDIAALKHAHDTP